MVLVDLDNQKDLIKNTCFSLNLVTLTAVSTGLLVWFFTPFLTEQAKNPKHQLARILSLVYVTGAGSVAIFGSQKLSRLAKYKTAIEKAEDNNFINTVASSQYANQKILEGESEQAIAINLIKGPQPEILEGEIENDDDLPNIPGIEDHHWEALAIAREKGELSPRELQRSGLGQRLSLKADSAKEILNDLANANLGKLEEEGEKIKFLPLS